MGQKNSKDRYQKFIDAGKAVSRLTGERFEEVAKDLIHLSNGQRTQAHDLIEDVLKKSKKSTEFVVDVIKSEVDKQLKSLKVVSKEDLSIVTERINQMKSDIAAIAALREELRSDVAKLSEAIGNIVVRKSPQATPSAPVDTSTTTQDPQATTSDLKVPPARKPAAPRKSRAKTPPKPTE